MRCASTWPQAGYKPSWTLRTCKLDSTLHANYFASRYMPLSLAACQRKHCLACFPIKAASCPAIQQQQAHVQKQSTTCRGTALTGLMSSHMCACVGVAILGRVGHGPN